MSDAKHVKRVSLTATARNHVERPCHGKQQGNASPHQKIGGREHSEAKVEQENEEDGSADHRSTPATRLCIIPKLVGGMDR